MTGDPPPPGPRGLPLLGSALAFRRDPLGFFTRTAREWGDVAGFRLGPLRCCLVSRPDLIGRVLENHDADVVKPWDERQLGVALGEGLLTGSGEQWQRQRLLVEPAFRGERIRAYAAVMGRRATEAAHAWRPGQEIDVHAEMQRLMLAIVGETLLGAELAPRARAIADGLGTMTDRFERMLTGWLPIPLTAPLPRNWRLHRAVRQLHAAVGEVVAERRASGMKGDDLLGSLLEAQDGSGAGLDERELREIVLTLLAAGHETTALALTWALHLLGRHPEIDARLAAEARSALTTDLPDFEAVRNLPLARQVIREALRLYPPAWGIGREAIREIELDGHRLAAGTQIFFAPWVTHRDPRWFPAPEAFRPERWADDAPSVPALAWFPFGAGPRACLGSGFAMVEAPLVLAVLVRRWRFRPVSGHPIDLQPAITLRPRHGIRMRIEPRPDPDDRNGEGKPRP